MSNQQPNAWQTAGRPRHSHSASRTPQNRSGTASPSQQGQTMQPPRHDSGRPQQQINNVWASRSSSVGGSNGSSRAESGIASQEEQQHTPVNGFNAGEVRDFLSREAVPQAYKPAEASGAGRGNGAAWGSKPNHMANNQPFFVQLAKQIATMEGGG